MNTDNPAPHLTEQQNIERAEPATPAANPAMHREAELPYHSRAKAREIATEAEPAPTSVDRRDEPYGNGTAPIPAGQTRLEHLAALNTENDTVAAGPPELLETSSATGQEEAGRLVVDDSQSRGEHFNDLANIDGQATTLADSLPEPGGNREPPLDAAGSPEVQPGQTDPGQPDEVGSPGDSEAEPPETGLPDPAEQGGEGEPEDLRDIVCGGDRTAAEPLDGRDRQDFANYRQRLEAEGLTRAVTKAGDEYDYQRQYCGDTEYRITPDSDLPRSAWADGLNDELALAQDAKYVKSDSRSWFIPESMPPAMQGLAEEVMDKRLIKYRDVIHNDDNPIRGLEIIVNSPAAAQAVAARMNALGVPGIVRIRPLGE